MSLLDRLTEPQNLARALVVLLGLLAVTVVLATGANVVAFESAADSRTALRSVDEGRKVGSAVTCATTSAIIDAGRETIESGAYVRPREFAAALERLGLPPFTTRAQYAAIAAQSYARNISVAVGRTGVRGVVRTDGSLDCAALRRAAKIGVTP